MTCTQLAAEEAACNAAAASFQTDINDLKVTVIAKRQICYADDSSHPLPMTLSAAISRREALGAAQPPNTGLIAKYDALITPLTSHDNKVQQRETQVAMAEAFHDKWVQQGCT